MATSFLSPSLKKLAARPRGFDCYQSITVALHKAQNLPQGRFNVSLSTVVDLDIEKINRITKELEYLAYVLKQESPTQ